MPPGLSMTSSVMPWMMNMVDSVTTIGCSRRKAMKKPLKAPVSMPMPMPTAGPEQHVGFDVHRVHRPGEDDIDQRDDGAGREVEAAGEDDDRLADGGEGQVAPPLERKVTSK